MFWIGIIVLVKTVLDKLSIGMMACFSGFSCYRSIFCLLVKLFSLSNQVFTIAGKP